MGTALPRAPAPLSRSDAAERLACWPSRGPLASRVHRPGSLDTIGYTQPPPNGVGYTKRTGVAAALLS